MNLLTKSCVEKLDKKSAIAELSHGKLSIVPMADGFFRLRFAFTFTPYKTACISAVAKKFGPAESEAVIGVEFFRRGKLFCTDAERGMVIINEDNYTEYKLRYFIPFGVDEAFVTVKGRGGASVSMLALAVETSAFSVPDDGGIECIADGGLSAYAPGNTMPALLAAMRAGFRKIIVDAAKTADGEIVCSGAGNLSAVSDGEGRPEDYTLEKLKTLDFGMFADPFYKNTRIVTLKEALMQFAGEGIIPFIRINGDGFPAERLTEILGGFQFGTVYIISDSDELRKKICGERHECSGDIRFAYPSYYYNARGGKNAADYSELMENGIEIIPVINYSDELKKFVCAGEKTMITSVYQLKGCKLD